MQRDDRVLPAETYMQRLNDFGVVRRHNGGNWDSSHMILDILYGIRQKRSLFNNYDLAECRITKTFAEINYSDTHWFDNKPLIEML